MALCRRQSCSVKKFFYICPILWGKAKNLRLKGEKNKTKQNKTKQKKQNKTKQKTVPLIQWHLARSVHYLCVCVFSFLFFFFFFLVLIWSVCLFVVCLVIWHSIFKNPLRVLMELDLGQFPEPCFKSLWKAETGLFRVKRSLSGNQVNILQLNFGSRKKILI